MKNSSNFNSVCNRRNLTVNVSDSKIMIFEGSTNSQCRVNVNEQDMENVGWQPKKLSGQSDAEQEDVRSSETSNWKQECKFRDE